MRAVNLIPGDQRASSGSLAGRSGGAALILLGMVFGVAVLAVMYGQAHRQIVKEKGEVAKLEAQTAEVRARTGRLVPYTSFVAMAEQRTKTVAQLVQARFDWSHTVRELGRVLPSGSDLLSLTGTVGSGASGSRSSAPVATSGSATASSSTPPGSTPTIILGGCSVSQAEVAQTLQRLKLMDGVSEVHLTSSVQGGKGGGSAGGGSTGAGSCPEQDFAYSVTVTFAALPATPIPNVAPTVPASSSTARSAHAEQVSAQQSKGAGR